MRRRVLFVSILSSFWTVGLVGQTITPPVVEWQKSFGGAANDDCFVIRQAVDSGYLLAGSSQSGISGNKQTTNYGGSDGWVVRLDRDGNKLWEQSIGGVGEDIFYDARQTPDGGWILTGVSGSPPSGNKTSPLWGGAQPWGGGDYWVVRLDANGALLWDKSFGGTGNDVARAILPTADGGFLVGGWSLSGSNGLKTMPNIPGDDGYPQGPDFWVLRVDADRAIVWQKAYGGYREDNLSTIEPRPGGGFILAGDSSSPPSGNKQSPVYYSENVRGPDFWIVCIDDAGQIVWEKSYGGSDSDFGPSLCVTPEGGCLVAGYTYSGISGNKTTAAAADTWRDVWVVRLDPAGNKVWERDIGGLYDDQPHGVHLAADGGVYLTLGSAKPTGPWERLIRLDANGNQLWETAHTNRQIYASCSVLSSDGGILLAGDSWLTSNSDFAVMKLSTDPLLLMPRLQMLSSEARVRLKGMPGKTYLTERTGNFLNWFPVSTNTLSSGETEIVDPTSAVKRFYRASLVP